MRSAALTLALLILLSGAAPAIATVPPGVDGGQEPAPATAFDAGVVAQLDGEQPPTEIRIQLEANTDARWTITHRYPLTSETEVEAFRSFGERFESGRSDVGFDVSVFRSIADTVSVSTDRPMTIRDVERTATVNRTETNETDTERAIPTTTAGGSTVNATGVLQLSFTWTNFLEQDDDGTLRLGDVFTTPDERTWLSSLGDDQRLTVVTPPGYVISRTSFPIQQQNGSLIIDGPREFTNEERLSVTYQETGRTAVPWTLIVGGGVAIALILALVGISRGRRTDAASKTTATNGGESSVGDSSADGPSAGPTLETGDETDVADTVDDETDAEETATPDETDIELLSDEERVERLLRERGGRMKQANIVKETGWSDAKVSQLLSAMASEGRVEKLRLGRENLISLPDEESAGEEDS
jgi:uncharacterized membrane protein